MALKFTLEEMQATLTDAQRYTNAYSEAITELDTTIKALSSDWVSTEIGTYEAFVEKYNLKRQKLFDARDYMIKFCNKLNEKIIEFQEAGDSIKSNFL